MVEGCKTMLNQLLIIKKTTLCIFFFIYLSICYIIEY